MNKYDTSYRTRVSKATQRPIDIAARRARRILALSALLIPVILWNLNFSALCNYLGVNPMIGLLIILAGVGIGSSNTDKFAPKSVPKRSARRIHAVSWPDTDTNSDSDFLSNNWHEQSFHMEDDTITNPVYSFLPQNIYHSFENN